MVRTVKVRLELDRDDYKRGLREAATEVRGFDGEVRAMGKDMHAAGVEVKATGTQVQSMGREVDAAARKTTTLGDEADKTKRKTTGLGDETGKTKAKIVDLAKEITTTKAALAALGEEFQRTGQINVDELNRLSRSLRDLERAKATIGKLIPGDSGLNGGGGFDFGSALADIGRIIAATLDAGGSLLDVATSVATTIGTGVRDGLSSLAGLVQAGFEKGLDALSGGLPAMGRLSSTMTTVLAAAAVAAAPAIGAAINGGVLLGVGGGALAAGIIAAAQDQQVQAAYKDLGGFVVQTFRTASEPLVAPLLRGAARFEDAWMGMLPGVRQGLAQLGPVIDRIVDGLVGMLRNVGPGFGRAFEASLPLLKQVGDELPKLGLALSSFFDSMARGGPGAVMFFHDLMSIIDQTIVVVGVVVGLLSKAWELSHKLHIGGVIQHIGDKAKDSGDKAKDGAGGVKEFADAAEKAATEAAKLSDLARQVGFASQMAGLGARIAEGDFSILSQAISDAGSTSDMLAGKMTDRLMGTMLGMSHATLGVQSGLLNLKETFEENGRAIDRHTGLVATNTKAGISNREAVLGAIEGNLRMYDAQIASGVGADVAAAKYAENTKALHDQLRQAGLTEKQVEDLIGEYGRVPGKVNTSIAMNGLTEAINGLNDLLRRLLGLPPLTTVRVRQIIEHQGDFLTSSGAHFNRWGGVYTHAATGALRDAQVYSAVSSGARYAFAEPATGGEAFVPKYGDYGRSMSILSQAASWYGARVMPGGSGGGTVINLNVHAGMGVDGDALARQMAGVLRPYIKSVGGGNVQVALGR